MTHHLSFAHGAHLDYIEGLYESYKKDPKSVESSWCHFFEGYEFALEQTKLSSRITPSVKTKEPLATESRDHAKVEALVNAHRSLGHLSAHLNPLADKPPVSRDMKLSTHGLENVDTTSLFHPPNFGENPLPLETIILKLTKTYCGFVGADFRDLNNIEQTTWLQKQMESCDNAPALSSSEQKQLLTKLLKFLTIVLQLLEENGVF